MELHINPRRGKLIKHVGLKIKPTIVIKLVHCHGLIARNGSLGSAPTACCSTEYNER